MGSLQPGPAARGFDSGPGYASPCGQYGAKNSQGQSHVLILWVPVSARALTAPGRGALYSSCNNPWQKEDVGGVKRILVAWWLGGLQVFTSFPLCHAECAQLAGWCRPPFFFFSFLFPAAGQYNK